MPSSCSRDETCLDTAGWLMRSRCAAPMNDRSLATAANARSRASSNMSSGYQSAYEHVFAANAPEEEHDLCLADEPTPRRATPDAGRHATQDIAHRGGLRPEAATMHLRRPSRGGASPTSPEDGTAEDHSNGHQTSTEGATMKRHLIIAGAVSGLVAFSLATGTADAHNAAHFFLPDGTCHDVGSNKEAPIVGAANPNQSRIYNLPGQLDLIP